MKKNKMEVWHTKNIEHQSKNWESCKVFSENRIFDVSITHEINNKYNKF